MMPASTQRAHFEPAWTGDSFVGLRQVSRHELGPDGIRATDTNLQWFWRKRRRGQPRSGEAFALHYPSPGRNNFRYIASKGGQVRPMTRAELRRTNWTPAQVLRWRRGPKITSARPRTYYEMVRKAVELDVVICAELKSGAFRRPLAAQSLVDDAKAVGHPPWFMALYQSMPFCRGKCKAVIQAGGQFAVIFGRFQRLRPLFRRAVKTWRIKPTRVW